MLLNKLNQPYAVFTHKSKFSVDVFLLGLDYIIRFESYAIFSLIKISVPYLEGLKLISKNCSQLRFEISVFSNMIKALVYVLSFYDASTNASTSSAPSYRVIQINNYLSSNKQTFSPSGLRIAWTPFKKITIKQSRSLLVIFYDYSSSVHC